MPIGGYGVLTEGHSRDVINNYATGTTGVFSSATPDAFGSWVEMIADVGDHDILVTQITVGIDDIDPSDKLEIEIGTGASASEARIFGILSSGNAVDATMIHDANSRVPSGSRISIRVRDNTSAVEIHRIKINYIIL